MAKSKKLCATIEDQSKWVVGIAQKPVFIDGLSHELFYLIVAAKSADDYKAVVIGKFGSDNFKVKMYGSFEDWGFNEASLQDKFNAHGFYSRKTTEGYERYWTNRRGVAMLLAALMQTRGVTVCPVEEFEKAYDLPMETRREICNLLHPARGGGRPQIPFTPPHLLTDQSKVADLV